MPRRSKSKNPARLQVEPLEDRFLLDGSSASTPSPHQFLVAQLYLDLLQRAADPTGLANWTKQLDGGTSVIQVVQLLESSPEYRTLEVQNLYEGLLGRAADANGLIHYVQLLGQGWNISQVEANLLESDEYFQSRSGNDNLMFVTALYRDVLGRDVDSIGMQSFVVPLANGLSRTAVVLGILSSGEAVQREVNLLYEKYLFRPADDSGLQHFTQAMQQGTAPENVIATLLGSDEYASRILNLGSPQSGESVRYQQVASKLLAQFGGGSVQATDAPYWAGVLSNATDSGHALSTGILQFLNSTGVLENYIATTMQSDLSLTGTLDQIEAAPDVAAAVDAYQGGADFNSVRSGWLATDAFYQAVGGDDTDYINKIYQVVLGRLPTDNELGVATTGLLNGTRQAFIEGLLNGQEACGVVVTHWLTQYLGLGPAVSDIQATADFTYWTQQLTTYGDPMAILSELLATQEYLGFPSDLYDPPSVSWQTAPGPYAQPVAIQRGTQSTFHVGDPVLTTTYFYWYDATSGTNVFYSDGTSAITDHPPTLDGFSYLNESWHATQLSDMADAGIDVALPVAYTTPFSDPFQNDPSTLDPSLLFTDEGIPPMVAARHQLVSQGVSAPYLGMFYDTTSLSATDNSKHYQVDLRTLGGKLWFYESIRNYFSHIPSQDWACIDGQPLIFLYHLGSGAGVDENVIGFVRSMFEHDFGVDAYIVAPDETLAPGIAFSTNSQPWVNEFAGKTAFGVLSDMLASDQFYTAAGGSDSGLVSRLYEKLLYRAPDAAGQQLWLNALSFLPREQVVQAFLYNNESLSNFVAGWYQTYLRRVTPLATLASSPELGSWVSQLKSGTDPLNVLAGILASPEFYAASGGSDQALVDNLYQRVLLRVADSGGEQYWIKRLGQVSSVEMIREFLHTTESYQVLVGGWLRYFLGLYYPGSVNAQYSWGGALAPAFRDVAAIGPGYDQSAARGRARLVVSRQDGQTYEQDWQELLAMNPRPWLVHIETWDEFIEGSDIADTLECGRQYIDLTKQFADAFHNH
jgi:hypothetical protein